MLELSHARLALASALGLCCDADDRIATRSNGAPSVCLSSIPKGANR
ncbi:hypothetical protein SAMN05216224_101422 [Thioclava dalianensis]|nr:hypothetical protein SAMN05216224_101422 [Thioclava dalianensis]